jgi:probable HAF family extracellular repeat protein
VKTKTLRAFVLLCLAIPVGAAAQNPKLPHYKLTDLGAIAGSPFSQATYINDAGVITGLDVAADGSQHAALWYKNSFADISSPGLGGPNSGAFGINLKGTVDGIAESSDPDPNNENFCAYFTGLKCLPFVWQKGVMTALPLLGGNNGTVSIINNRGQIAGAAETGQTDPACPTQPAVNGTGPQVLDYLPVIWGPAPGTVRKLPLLSGDTVGMALWINDKGETVGYSGTCATSEPPPFAAATHAVKWDADGTPHDLGSLGGTFNPASLGIGNVAFAINNRGQVVGISALPGSKYAHAFHWTRDQHMQDLGTLPGDLTSAALGMNNVGDVVGASIDTDVATGNPRAVLWRGGKITDLNTLVASNSSLYLLTAFMINDGGQIVGFGLDLNSFEIHAFLATPDDGDDDYAMTRPEWVHERAHSLMENTSTVGGKSIRQSHK